MSRPGFIEGALVALAAAICAAIAGAMLPPLIGTAGALRVLVAGLVGAYLCYLIGRSRETSGRVVIPLLFLAASVAGWALPQTAFVLMHVLLLSLVRSLYFHGGALAALADLGLSTLATAGAAWAMGTESWTLAAWTFFLIQALFPWIPCVTGPRQSEAPPDDRFEAARTMAQAALERLATKH